MSHGSGSSTYGCTYDIGQVVPPKTQLPKGALSLFCVLAESSTGAKCYTAVPAKEILLHSLLHHLHHGWGLLPCRSCSLVATERVLQESLFLR